MLVAGQNLALPEHATFEVHTELSYRMTIPDAEADLSMILLEGSGMVGSTDDFIFYNQPSTADRSVQLAGKTVAAGTVTERVELHLTIAATHHQRVGRAQHGH